MNTMAVTCVHHDDVDGFMSAVLVHKAYKDTHNVTLHEVDYQSDLSNVPGKDMLVCVDFTPSGDVLADWSLRFKTVLIIDHHIRTLEAVKKPLHNVIVYADIKKSATLLTWEYLFTGQEIPLLVQIVNDYDLWELRNRNTLGIIMALESYTKEVDLWADILHWPLRKLWLEGETILRAKKQEIFQHLKKHGQLGYLDQYNKQEGLAFICNIPHAWVNIAADIIMYTNSEVDYFMGFYDTGKGWKYSLRTDIERDCDVNKLANCYKGGGHRCAAGFHSQILEHTYANHE